MPAMIERSSYQPEFINWVLARCNLKNDAALARELNLPPPVISKVRHGVLGVGPTLILALHERFGVPVAEIRSGLASPNKGF